MSFEEILVVGLLLWEEDLLPYYERVSQLDLNFE